jgi:hypothetical protein
MDYCHRVKTFMYIICVFVLYVLVYGLLPPGENPIAVNNNNNNNNNKMSQGTWTVCYTHFLSRAVPWLRRLVAIQSLWGRGFSSRLVHVGFVTEKGADGQVLLQIRRIYMYRSI